MSKTLSKTDKATKLAIIFTSGGGSSWAQGSDDDNYVLAYRAGKYFKQSWKHMFKFKKLASKNYVFIFMTYQRQRVGQQTTLAI